MWQSIDHSVNQVAISGQKQLRQWHENVPFSVVWYIRVHLAWYAFPYKISVVFLGVAHWRTGSKNSGCHETKAVTDWAPYHKWCGICFNKTLALKGNCKEYWSIKSAVGSRHTSKSSSSPSPASPNLCTPQTPPKCLMFNGIHLIRSPGPTCLWASWHPGQSATGAVNK